MGNSNRGKKITLAWDIDDVLNDLMRNWLEAWWRPQHPDCTLNYEDIKKNPPHQLLGVELDEYLQSIDDFRLSGYYEQMQPNFKVLEWFKKNGSSFRHIALTSVPRIAASVSAAWVIRHFGDWIRTFHFVPSLRLNELLPQYYRSKGDFLRWWGKADILVDDNPDNLAAAQTLGIQTICMPQPWNCSRRTSDETLESLTILSNQ